MPGLARGNLARAFGNRAHLTLLACVQGDQPVSLAPIRMAEDYGVNTDGTEFGHKSDW
jgi:hypothetical protein